MAFIKHELGCERCGMSLVPFFEPGYVKGHMAYFHPPTQLGCPSDNKCFEVIADGPYNFVRELKIQGTRLYDRIQSYGK